MLLLIFCCAAFKLRSRVTVEVHTSHKLDKLGGTLPNEKQVRCISLYIHNTK